MEVMVCVPSCQVRVSGVWARDNSGRGTRARQIAALLGFTPFVRGDLRR